MATDVKELLRRARSAPKVLKIIAAVIAVDLIILLIAALALEDEVGERADQIDQLRAELTTQRNKNNEARKEIARLPELRRLYDAAIDDGVLADQDRLKLVARAQDLGNQYHLSDLHYKLDPEDFAPAQGSKYTLVSTPVSLIDGAYLDNDVLAFWSDVLGKLQSHYRITKATIDSNGLEPAFIVDQIKQGRPVTVMKAELDFRWISLRDTPKPSEAKK